MLFTSLMRTIKNSLGRFLAIFAIIALGVGLFGGLRVCAPSMKKTADKFYAENDFYDFRLVSTVGFEADDRTAFEDVSGVVSVVPSVSSDVLYRRGEDSDGAVHTHMITEGMNTPVVVSGHMPEKADECAVDSRMYGDEMLGKRIVLSGANDGDTLDLFKSGSYVITARVKSPLYVYYERGSTSLGNGTVDGFILIPEDGFDTDVYTELFLKTDAGGEIYSSEYNDRIDALAPALELLLENRAGERFSKLKSEAETELSDAKKEYSEKKDDAQKELSDAKRELDDARAELDDAEKTLSEKKDEMKKAGFNDDMIETYFESAEKELNDAETEYADAMAEYEDAVKEADEEFAEAEEKIADADKKLSDLSLSTFVLDRYTNQGYAGFEKDIEIITGVSKVFPLFFLIVASLVCIITMTKMVDDQRTKNGVLKALGYKDSSIVFQYLFYSGTASLAGCALGFLFGSGLIPFTLWKAYGIMYNFDTEILFVFDKKLFAVCTLLYMACSLGTTWMVCRKELSEPAAELIRPKAPKSGKRVLLERIPFIWNRLSFLRKVSVRNILRYTKRMIMVVIGIGGCTALLLTGFGIQDSINDIANIQYKDITVSDATVTFDSAPDSGERTSFEKFAEEFSAKTVFSADSYMDIVNSAGDSENVDVIAFEDSLEDFYILRDGETELQWPGENCAVVNRRLQRDLGINPGDAVILKDSDGHETTVTVSGIFDNYIGDYVFVSLASFNEESAPELKCANIIFKDGIDEKAAGAKILKRDDVISVSLTSDVKNQFDGMLSSLDYIIFVIIALSGALAFIVLYNLTNISISERIREIATLKVLGFYGRETAQYVFRENILLTLISIVAGIPMGIGLLSYVISRIRVSAIFFEPILKPESYLYAAVITFVFALVVNFFLRFRLDSVNMAESMKAIE